MIDLHTHTNHSDGSSTPEELLRLASESGLDSLAITDHDTFAGYDEAATIPHDLELVCGLELTTKYDGHTVHLLGYFLRGAPPEFRQWIEELHACRRDRNQRLADRLQSLGIGIRLEEAERIGRTMTGRPHFARLLIERGYAVDFEEAFRKFLGEGGAAFVTREAPAIEEGIARIRQGGGIPSLAHPVRVCTKDELKFLGYLRDQGLLAVEAFHSDHRKADTQRYMEFARRLGLALTGGSDFHGAVKPRVRLGMIEVDNVWLEELRKLTT